MKSKIILFSLGFTLINITHSNAQLSINGTHNMISNDSYENLAGRGVYSDGTDGVLNMNGYTLLIDNVSSAPGLSGYGFSVLSANVEVNGANGYLNVSNSAAIGIISANIGNLVINNTNIITTKNGTHGISAGTNNSRVVLNGSGNNFIMANENTNAGISTTAFVAINDYDIETSNNGWFGIRAHDGGRVNIAGKGNNLLVKNNSDGGINSYNDASKIDILDMNITSAGNDTFLIYDSGEITIKDTNVNVLDDSYLLKVTAVGSNIGIFNAIDSTLMNSISTDSGAVSNVNLSNVNWSNIGLSNVSNLTLDNVNIYMDSYFGEDFVNVDKLIIEESSSGKATLFVTSLGTDGSQPDVLLIDASGAETNGANNAVFNLYGDVVDSGAYEYELKQQEDGSWYLQSNGNITNAVKTLSNVPVMSIHIVKTGMNELRKRMGELRDNSPYSKHGVWVRSYARHLKVDEKVDSHMNIFGIEGGYDFQVYGDCDNKAYVGFMTGYSYTDNMKTRNTRSTNSEGHANTPTVGLYGTWLHKDGWFADATIRSFWTDVDMKSYTSQGISMDVDLTRQFTSGSLEIGRQWRFNANSKSSYVLEPKAEFSYAYAKSKDAYVKSKDFRNRLHYGSTDSASGRVSIMGGYNHKLDNGGVLEPFIQVSIIEEFGGVTHIKYDGVNYKSDISGTSFEFGGGLNAQLNSSWGVYGDIMYETGSHIDSFSGNLGVRYIF